MNLYDNKIAYKYGFNRKLLDLLVIIYSKIDDPHFDSYL